MIINLGISKDEIDKKINLRYEYKKNKDFENADKIRKELLDKGIVLNDTREGTVWSIK